LVNTGDGASIIPKNVQLKLEDLAEMGRETGVRWLQ
jgi:hypothetical protein